MTWGKYRYMEITGTFFSIEKSTMGKADFNWKVMHEESTSKALLEC